MTTLYNAFEAFDRRFRYMTVGSAGVDMLFDGCRWAEGPVWFNDGRYLVWSDIPNNRMLRYVPDGGVDVFRADSNDSNGNTRDRQGRLVTCEHGGRRVSRTEVDGSITVLADGYNGRKLNSPNDVVVKSDGTIWFTDPPYGILSDHEGIKAEPEIDKNQVYRFDPKSGALSVVADDFDRPNGLAFSPDESELYIADSGRARGNGFGMDDSRPHHVRALKVVAGTKLGSSRVVAVIEEKVPDGLRVDTEGLLWISAGDGVHCYTPGGLRLGRIKVPEVVANLTFGGLGKSRMFICATSSVYAIETMRCGAQTP